jgi:hypothetical protein
MDLVLGLSMTSTAVRWVLVEGTTGEGTTIDRGISGIDTVDTLPEEIAAAFVDRLHAIGVTWTDEAEDAASIVLQALTARGLDNVIAVSELEATEALAAGVAARAGYNDIAVCLIEDDASVVALVDSEGVTVDRIDRPLDGADAAEHAAGIVAMLDLNDRQPDAIFVVGSADDGDLVASSLDSATEALVFSAAEAELALARGSALASAGAVNTLDAPSARRRLISRNGALASVLVAAVVTFVVSLSVALGLRLAPGSDSGTEQQQQLANAAEPVLARVAGTPPVAQAAPQQPRPGAPPSPAAPPPDALPPVAHTIAVAPPAAQSAPEPVREAPAAAPAAPPPVYQAPIAPAPAYVPPAPAYVPPSAPPPAYVPEPRLRDRIIERIPIINRFHEPEYPYG